MHLLFKLVSILLRYPSEELKTSLPQIRQAVSELPVLKAYETELNKVLTHLEETDLLALQMEYVNAFDLNRKRSISLSTFMVKTVTVAGRWWIWLPPMKRMD